MKLEEESGMRLRLAILFFVFTSMTTISALAGQQPNDPPPAPVPAPIFTAKKVFVSNATGEIALPPGNPDLTYNEFYAAMKSWGRYELVSSPADADLVIEIRLAYTASNPRSLRATVRDPKTR